MANRITSTDIFKIVAGINESLAEGTAIEDIFTDEVVAFAEEYLEKRKVANERAKAKNAEKRAASGADAAQKAADEKVVADIKTVLATNEAKTRDQILEAMAGYQYANGAGDVKDLTLQKISTVLAKAEGVEVVTVLNGDKTKKAYKLA